MRKNRLRESYESKKTALGGWVAIGHAYSAELMGHCGYETVVVDLQHGPLYLDSAATALTALSSTPSTPMARVSANNFFEINKLLDAGAYGLICPMIDTADDAASFVSACRYPPQGTRSFGPARGLLYGGADYFAHANETIITYAMIETPASLENLEAIAATPGLDGLFIGPADLSLALGVNPPVKWLDEPLRSTMLRILKVAHDNGKMAGVFCISEEMAIDMKKDGYDFVVYGVDANLMLNSGKQAVKAIQEG